MTEKVLNYDHSITPQERYWDCGPASTQVVLNGRGIVIDEQTLINQIGTTEDGTPDVNNIVPVLNSYVGGGYETAHMPNDPPEQDEKDALWNAIVNSIDAGFGMVANIVAPPSNYPRGVKGSISPAYAGGTVYHYIALMGYDADERAVWVADSGFRPFGYWISFDQLATLIPPKGYIYRTGGGAPQQHQEDNVTDSLFADVSEFQVPIDDSYPYRIVSFRSNDGTYRDHNFAQNYAWAKAAADAGRITCFIVYYYWRTNWEQTLQTHQDMINANGGPHPKMISMIDLESGGNPGGDWSRAINATREANIAWLGGNRARVIGYANRPDADHMWPDRGDTFMIGAGYGSNPRLPNQVAHQYTDGQGYGGGLPEGCPPFGNCDMNAANGYSPEDFAAKLGVGSPRGNAINDKAAQSPWLGNRITQGEAVCPDGKGRYAQFENGYIYWSPSTGAHPIPANLFGKFGALGWEAGPLGYPVLDHRVLPDGEVQAFQGGLLYRKDPCPDVFFVHGAIGDRWAKAGYENSPMGWPKSDEYDYDGGRAQDFEHGTVYWAPSNVVFVAK